MAEPADLVRASRSVIEQLRRIASAAPNPVELPGQLLGPLQRQAELLERALTEQAELRRELAQGLTTPLRRVQDVLAKSAEVMRGQATALDVAAASFKQASELLETQAALLESASAVLGRPADLLGGRDVAGAPPRRSG